MKTKEEKIDLWKKLIAVIGFTTLEIGHLTDNKTLIITGILSTLIGMILIFMIK